MIKLVTNFALGANYLAMTEFTKGGRGKKAPYETTHYRVPEPCKNTVELLCKTWKFLIADEEEGNTQAKNLLTAIENVTIMHYTQDLDKPVNGFIYKAVDESKEEEIKLVNRLSSMLKEALEYEGRSTKKLKEKISEILMLIEE